MTAAEYYAHYHRLALVGFILGTWRVNAILGIALAVVFGFIPVLIMKSQTKTQVAALHESNCRYADAYWWVGYGLVMDLAQAIEVLIERLGPPASTEMANVMRAVGLGQPIRYALQDAADRIGSDDFNLVVIAINVQYETGGNLAESLETIASTVRHRLHILQEIRVLTAQQRLTGYVLAFLPFGLALVMFFINPDYISQLFEPGWVRLLPIIAIVMQVIGFLFIRRIVDIKV